MGDLLTLRLIFAAVRLVFLVTGLCFLRRPTDTIILEPNPPSTQALRRLVGRDSDDPPPSTKPLAFIAESIAMQTSLTAFKSAYKYFSSSVIVG